jgi:hypothetical protein
MQIMLIIHVELKFTPIGIFFFFLRKSKLGLNFIETFWWKHKNLLALKYTQLLGPQEDEISVKLRKSNNLTEGVTCLMAKLEKIKRPIRVIEYTTRPRKGFLFILFKHCYIHVQTQETSVVVPQANKLCKSVRMVLKIIELVEWSKP